MVRDETRPLNENATLAEAIAVAVGKLTGVSDSPRLDAELLLARAIDVPRSYVIAHPEDELDPAAGERFLESLERRCQGQPMAYVAGEKEFWSMTLMVTPATLVPRPETEHLVEQAIGCIPRRAACRVLDLGTGSGAIALAIARERPLCEVVATDLSGAALAVARQNARQLDLPNVEFLAGDWTSPLQGRVFDLVVSNPPYVAENDPALDALADEPREALAAGPDGLDAIRRLVADVPGVLVHDGVFLVEHGADQDEPVAALFSAAGWRDIRCVRDLAGLPRVTMARAPWDPSDDGR